MAFPLPSNKFDLVVLTAHYSGHLAFVNYINKTQTMLCYSVEEFGFNYERIQSFLDNNQHIHKGILIDTTPDDDKVSFVLEHCSSDFVLICLWRDPLDRFLSMYNLQVYNFTNISTGFYDEIKLPISDNPIYKFGSIEAAMSDMTRWGIMNTVANSVGIFSPHTSNRMIICTGDISVKKAYGTLERINSFISDTSIARFTIPEINYYSHKNNFVHYGISLRIGIKDKEYEFVPCPMEMVKLLPNRFKDVIFAINPKDIGFDAGDFPGDIAFLINGEHDRRTKAHIIELLKNNVSVIGTYCKVMSQRHFLAQRIAGPIKVDRRKLSTMLRLHPNLGREIHKYLSDHVSVLEKFKGESFSSDVVKPYTLDMINDLAMRYR